MFILAAMAAGVLTSFSASMLNEGTKYNVGNLWNADKDLSELQASLNKQLLELRETVKKIDARLNHSGLPSDWLDGLEKCRYEIEDIEDSMDLASKKLIVTNFLQTNIKYVKTMQSKLAKREHDMETVVRGPSRTQQLTNSKRKCQPDELLIWEEDKSNIIQELTTTKNQFGVSIIGIAGIGKTFLTESIKLDARIKGYFPCILSPQLPTFNLDSVLDYIKSAPVPSKDKRVLILLDGMHSITIEDWSNFRSECEEILNSESRFLITTQNPEVANVTGTNKYCLPPLLKEKCFSLIENHANANKNLCEKDKKAIKHNEENLVDACKGLPLLARQVGLLLSAAAQGNRQDAIIEIIRKRSSWKVPGLERVLVDLRPVSLLVQQPHLRRCLAYCSLFSNDYEFEANNLIQFWMAEGFTAPSTDATWMEETTRGYFDELLACSLFQKTASLPGEKPRYKLHGLFYDMALNVTSTTFCQKDIDNLNSNPEISKNTRHFSLRCKRDEEFIIDRLLTNLQDLCSGLRTFLLFRESGKMISKNPTFFQSLTRLRVLDLSHTNLTKLEISKLKHLRYLDLSFTLVKHLPKLSNSPELQVLKLNHCEKLLKLHEDLTKLTNLTSLQVNSRLLRKMPSGIGKLTNLQRLDLFIVGKKEGLKITELGNLNDLRSSLHITKLENVMTTKEAEQAMLCKKEMLERLDLEWSETNDTAEQVLEGLVPPKNLKELMIRNYSGVKIPEWLSTTKLLKSIRVENCQSLTILPELECLKSLEKLEISKCTKLKELPTLPPSLKSLIIKDNDILKLRCQVGGADRHKIKDIQVVIDSIIQI